MSTWILIVSFAIGYREGYQYAIPNLPSLQECVRVYNMIEKPNLGFAGHFSSQCIEVILPAKPVDGK